MGLFTTKLKLEELKEFNDLLTSLVQGEVELSAGLQAAAEGTNSKFRQLLSQLSHSVSMGVPMSQAVEQFPRLFPRQYPDVIQAGEQGGILGPVLESYSSYIDKMLEIRRQLGLAMLYPLLVFMTAYLLFFLVGIPVTKSYMEFDLLSRGLQNPLIVMMHSVYDSAIYWGWIPPFILILGWFDWVRSNNVHTMSQLTWYQRWRLLPLVLSTILKNYRIANFSELLAMLLTRNVPFTEAIRIAALATGEPAVIQPQNAKDQTLPPFLAWLIESGQAQADVGRPILHAASMYYRRAENLSEWLRLLSPLVFLIFIGGGATMLYVLAVYMPFVQVMEQLG